MSNASRTRRLCIRAIAATTLVVAILVLVPAGPIGAEEAMAELRFGSVIYVLRVAEEAENHGYSADVRPAWRRIGESCFSVRDKVLVEESLVPVAYREGHDGRCVVTRGRWYDALSDEMLTDASLVEIDHLVALKEAYDSGASTWDRDRFIDYANDLTNADHLIVVSGRTNAAKGDRDPADYLPSNPDYLLPYVEAWVRVKARWNLAVDPRELDAIRRVLAHPGEP